MRDLALPHFCGLDVGTAKVRCVIGAVNDQGQAEIIGHGEANNIGMRKGVVIHPDDVAHAVSTAIAEAEQISGRRIEKGTININGSHVSGVNSRGVIAISAANREITVDDRLRVEEAATIMQLPANRSIIQVFPKNYRLDGQDNIKDPVSMHGVRLEVEAHIVTGSTPGLKSLDQVLERATFRPLHRTVSALASAEAVLSRQQREAGTAVLDIGAGTTNLVVIEDGEVQHVAVLPIGGINITNDLAIGLKTDLEIAETVKLNFADLSGQPKRSVVNLSIEGSQHTFDNDDVKMIIEARVEELLELVDKELKKINRSKKLPGGVVIVGGTANIHGLSDFAKNVLELPARKGKLLPVGGLQDIQEDVSYTTAVGLMLLDMLLDGQTGFEEKEAVSRVIGKVGKLFKRRSR
jgi:cell division protein FtsA